jgi:Uncharacterized protein conserved in bacteria (DUF2059)
MTLCRPIFFSVLAATAASLSMLGPAAADNDKVVRLISAMKADDAEMLKLRRAVEWSVRDGRATQQYLECATSFSKSSFTPIFAKTFQEALSPDEIDDAVAFFEGPLGQKLIARRFALAYRAPGEPPPDSVPSYSESELQELRVIGKRTWGSKLIRYTVVDQPAHRQAVRAKTDDLLQTCSGR